MQEGALGNLSTLPYARYWALWEGRELTAVTVYKKGAVTLMSRLQQARRNTR